MLTGMVDDFQKQYQALQVPYPKDTLTASVESQAKEQKSAYDKFVSESKTRIAALATESAKWEAMKCPTQMTLEEALDECPELLKVNPDKPTFFPHQTSAEEFEQWKKDLKNMEDDH